MLPRLATSLLFKPCAASAVKQALTGGAVAALQTAWQHTAQPTQSHVRRFSSSPSAAYGGPFGGSGSGIVPVKPPRNLGITIVPERTAIVVER